MLNADVYHEHYKNCGGVDMMMLKWVYYYYTISALPNPHLSSFKKCSHHISQNNKICCFFYLYDETNPGQRFPLTLTSIASGDNNPCIFSNGKWCGGGTERKCGCGCCSSSSCCCVWYPTELFIMICVIYAQTQDPEQKKLYVILFTYIRGGTGMLSL